MNIAINQPVPEYTAQITLKPTPPMKIINKYDEPMLTGGQLLSLMFVSGAVLYGLRVYLGVV